MVLIHAAHNIGPQFLKSNQKKEVGCLPGHALYLQFGFNSGMMSHERNKNTTKSNIVVGRTLPANSKKIVLTYHGIIIKNMHTVVQILTMAVITLLFNNE